VTLQIELPPDIEARYAMEARAKGIPLERYISDRLIETARATGSSNAGGQAREHSLNLPLLKGTIIGSLSRRDIYDDRC
jgi:hypothetical protein